MRVAYSRDGLQWWPVERGETQETVSAFYRWLRAERGREWGTYIAWAAKVPGTCAGGVSSST